MARGNRFVISLVAADRVGILRDTSAAVTSMGGYIDGISQTVVAGYFTVILTARFGSRSVNCDKIRCGIERNFPGGEATVVVRPYDARQVRRAPEKGNRYVVTVAGKDALGILKKLTTFLAAKGINIEDWHVEFENAHVTHIGIISVPKKLDIRQVQKEFQALGKSMGMKNFIQHENIFRATNEVGAISSLLAGGDDSASTL